MIRLEPGDCLDVMRRLADEGVRVDSVVCDPPYGLEFMGKDWDRLDGGLPQENVWKGRRGKGGSAIGDDDTKPSSRHHVSYGAKRSFFKRCLLCGKREFSGSPCGCAAPSWVIETPEGAPSSAIRMQRWHEAWARLAFAILKPGGHLVAFGGTRTYHRLACAIEDAGFEIRDQLAWAYGTGFPKSQNVNKAIDKALGVKGRLGAAKTAAHERYIEKGQLRGDQGHQGWQRPWMDDPEAVANAGRQYLPDSEQGRKYAGWGTALKPAWEPICLARKPLIGTVAANVQQFGTGAINIDGCRIHASDAQGGEYTVKRLKPGATLDKTGGNWRPEEGGVEYHGEMKPGRWPANLIHDGSEEVLACFPDSGSVGPVRKAQPGAQPFSTERGWNSHSMTRDGAAAPESYGDTGSAARFFFSAKADADDRWGSKHPTVKPIDLMRWLARLVTPPGGTVLDPFAGSGTTGVACLAEGFNAILIERDAEYVADIRARLDHYAGTGKHSLSVRQRHRKPVDETPLFGAAL